MLFAKRMLPTRAVTIWPGAAVTGPLMTSVPPLEPKRPPAMDVCSMKIGPDKVPTPLEAERKMEASPLRPLANRTLIGLARLTPCSIWNWPLLMRLTTLVAAPRAPLASTRKVLFVPPLTLISPVKSFAGLRTIIRPVPTLVRPMLPVILESTAKTVVAGPHWWKMRSWPLPDVIEPPAMVTELAPTVGVTRMPPLATVRPAVASSVTVAAELKRRELTEIGEAPIVVSTPLSTLAPAA